MRHFRSSREAIWDGNWLQLPFAGRGCRSESGRTRPYVLATFGGLPLDFNGRLLAQRGPTVAAYISDQ
jgi:hypothetical protein